MLATVPVPYRLQSRAPAGGAWYDGLLVLAVILAVAVTVAILVAYGQRKLAARRLISGTERYLREQAATAREILSLRACNRRG